MPNGKKRVFRKRDSHPHLDIAIREDFSDLETACDYVIPPKLDPIRISNSFYYIDSIKKVPYYSLFIMDHNSCKFPLVKKVRNSLFIILYFRFSDSNNLDHIIISSENGTAIIKITNQPINQELITYLNDLPQVSVHLLLLNSPPSNSLLELGITKQFTEFLKENGNQEKFTAVFEHPSIQSLNDRLSKYQDQPNKVGYHLYVSFPSFIALAYFSPNPKTTYPQLAEPIHHPIPKRDSDSKVTPRSSKQFVYNPPKNEQKESSIPAIGYCSINNEPASKETPSQPSLNVSTGNSINDENTQISVTNPPKSQISKMKSNQPLVLFPEKHLDKPPTFKIPSKDLDKPQSVSLPIKNSNKPLSISLPSKNSNQSQSLLLPSKNSDKPLSISLPSKNSNCFPTIEKPKSNGNTEFQFNSAQHAESCPCIHTTEHTVNQNDSNRSTSLIPYTGNSSVNKTNSNKDHLIELPKNKSTKPLDIKAPDSTKIVLKTVPNLLANISKIQSKCEVNHKTKITESPNLQFISSTTIQSSTTYESTNESKFFTESTSNEDPTYQFSFTKSSSDDTKFISEASFTSQNDTQFSTNTSFTSKKDTQFDSNTSFRSSNETQFNSNTSFTSKNETKFNSNTSFTSKNDTQFNSNASFRSNKDSRFNSKASFATVNNPTEAMSDDDPNDESLINQMTKADWCPFCLKEFCCYEDVVMHIMNFHDLADIFFEQMATVQNKKPIRCQECNITYKTREMFLNHILTSHPEKFYQLGSQRYPSLFEGKRDELAKFFDAHSIQSNELDKLLNRNTNLQNTLIIQEKKTVIFNGTSTPFIQTETKVFQPTMPEKPKATEIPEIIPHGPKSSTNKISEVDPNEEEESDLLNSDQNQNELSDSMEFIPNDQSNNFHPFDFDQPHTFQSFSFNQPNNFNSSNLNQPNNFNSSNLNQPNNFNSSNLNQPNNFNSSNLNQPNNFNSSDLKPAFQNEDDEIPHKLTDSSDHFEPNIPPESFTPNNFSNDAFQFNSNFPSFQYRPKLHFSSVFAVEAFLRISERTHRKAPSPNRFPQIYTNNTESPLDIRTNRYLHYYKTLDDQRVILFYPTDIDDNTEPVHEVETNEDDFSNDEENENAFADRDFYRFIASSIDVKGVQNEKIVTQPPVQINPSMFKSVNPISLGIISKIQKKKELPEVGSGIDFWATLNKLIEKCEDPYSNYHSPTCLICHKQKKTRARFFSHIWEDHKDIL